MLWFSLLVLVPLSAIIATAAAGGWQNYIDVLQNPQTWNALKLTVSQSLLVTLINVVMGTVIAWVLVRDRFPGKTILNVIIDIPFALPTVVAGLVLLALYGPNSPIGVHWAYTERAVTLALAFVTLPFVVRTVQPVLEEIDADVEEAAASLGAGRMTIFRRIILPSLLPAITAGAALASPARSRSTARSCCSAATGPTRPRSCRCACCRSSRTAAMRRPRRSPR